MLRLGLRRLDRVGSWVLLVVGVFLFTGCIMTAAQEKKLDRVDRQQRELREEIKTLNEEQRAELEARISALDTEIDESRPSLPPVIIDAVSGLAVAAGGVLATWLLTKLGIRAGVATVQSVKRRRARKIEQGRF